MDLFFDLHHDALDLHHGTCDLGGMARLWRMMDRSTPRKCVEEDLPMIPRKIWHHKDRWLDFGGIFCKPTTKKNQAQVWKRAIGKEGVGLKYLRPFFLLLQHPLQSSLLFTHLCNISSLATILNPQSSSLSLNLNQSFAIPHSLSPNFSSTYHHSQIPSFATTT